MKTQSTLLNFYKTLNFPAMISCFKRSVIILIILVSFLPSKSLKSQVLTADSLALVEFYWAANGPNWTHNDNWLITKVELWYGVGLSNEYGDLTLPSRVFFLGLPNNNLNGTIHPLICLLSKAGFNLENNNLTGTIPPCIGNCDLSDLLLGNNQLTNPIPLSLGNDSINRLGFLDLSFNNFYGPFPDTIIRNNHIIYIQIQRNHFNSIGNKGNQGINVQLQENNLTFKDLIPYKNNLIPLIYMMPQDSVLESIDTTILIGSTFSMDAWVDTCSGNRYTWYKNGNWNNWNSPQSIYTINNAQMNNSGTYTCQINNPTQCSGVYLWRRTIHLTVSNTTGMSSEYLSQINCRINYRLREQTLDIAFNFPSEEKVSVKLYDETGRTALRLFEGTTSQQEFHHYLGWMKKGLYIVKVESKNGVFTKKVVVH